MSDPDRPEQDSGGASDGRRYDESGETRPLEPTASPRSAGRGRAPADEDPHAEEASTRVVSGSSGVARGSTGEGAPGAEKNEPPRPRVERIGPYDLLYELGRGGMGVVYLARDRRLNRRVALKTLALRFQDSELAGQRFQREQRAIAHLNHPGIVPIYDVGEEDGHPYFTMELVEGRTLAEMLCELRYRSAAPERLTGEDLLETLPLGKGGLEDETADLERLAELPGINWHGSYVEVVARLVLQIADALAHAHQESVLHRDVKPSNILVRRDGRALLFDFGLARLASETRLTGTGELAGTPAYLSPEQISAPPSGIDERTDVYSLGITLYEALTLRVPFEGETTPQLLRQVLSSQPRPPQEKNPAIPRDLETICLTAIEKEPDRRYASARAFADDLRAFLAFRPIQASPIGPVSRALRWVRRHRATSAALLLASLLVLGAPTAFWLLERSHANRLEALRLAERAARLDAEQSFGWARDAVERMLTRVARDRVGEIPGLRPLQRELLQEALVFQRQFLKDRGGDPRLRADIARTLLSMGNALDGLGRASEAERRYREAIELFGPDMAGRRGRGDAWMGLGKLLWDLGRWSEAETAYAQALDIRRMVFESNPDDPRHRRDLLAVLTNLAAADAERGRLELAHERFEEALSTFRGDEAPEDGEAARTLAITETQYGVVLMELGELADARQRLESARARLESFEGMRDDDSERQRRLAAVYENLGLLGWTARQAISSNDEIVNARVAMGRQRQLRPVAQLSHLLRGSEEDQILGESRQHLERALEPSRDLVERFPSIPLYRSELARVRNNLSLVLLDLEETEAARRELTAAFDMARAVHDEQPERWAAGRTAAAAAINLAASFGPEGASEQVIHFCRQAIHLLEEELSDNARLASDRRMLASARSALARELAETGELASADAELARAAAIIEEAMAASEPGANVLVPDLVRVLLSRARNAGRSLRFEASVRHLAAARQRLEKKMSRTAGLGTRLAELRREVEELESEVAEWVVDSPALAEETYRWARRVADSAGREEVSAEELSLRGAAAFRLGLVEEARRDLRESLEAQAVFGPRLKDLARSARALQAAGETEEARQKLELLAGAVAGGGELAEPYEHLLFAVALADLGELEPAREQLALARELLESDSNEMSDPSIAALLTEIVALVGGEPDGDR